MNIGNKMSTQRVSSRLHRLVKSEICEAEDASKYAEELRQLANMVANAGTAKARSRFFKALADEKRMRILSLLKVREMCVCEVMVALDLTQPNASHHLGILENVGVVKRRKEGKWVYYAITDQGLLEKINTFDFQ